MDDDRALEDLIALLRRRIADPERRVDIRPRAFDREVTTLSLGDLLRTGSGLAAQLGQVVDANRTGMPLGADVRATVDRLATSMATTPPDALRPPATSERLTAVERDLGFALPEPIRSVYGEVADGGFGPGSGLLPIAKVATTYHEFRVDAPMAPDGQTWPDGLLPVLRYDLGVDAVEASTGRMIAWDPESLTERSGAPGWRRTFADLAPSFTAWLGEWVGAPTQAERLAASTEAAMREQARASRAYIAALNPAERAAMGLPETGWEAVVWGGLGYEAADEA